MSNLFVNLYNGIAIILTIGIFSKLFYDKIKRNQDFTVFKLTLIGTLGYILIVIGCFLENADYTGVISIIYVLIYVLILFTFLPLPGNRLKTNITNLPKNITASIIRSSNEIMHLGDQLLNPYLIGGIILLILSIVIFSLVNSGVL